MKPFVASSFALLLLASAASADTFVVPTDFATIQEAVDNAASGDVVKIKAGNYRENVTVITSGIDIVGSGSTKTVIDGAYLGASMTVTADDVKLSGITFSNGGLEYTGKDAAISKCRVRSSADDGLTLTGSGTISDTTISTCLGTGLVVTSGAPAGPLTTLRNTDVLHCGVGVAATDGPFLITKCTFANNSGDGLALSFTGASTPTVTTQVTKNNFMDNEGAGILLSDDLGAVTDISDNDVNANGRGLDLS